MITRVFIIFSCFGAATHIVWFLKVAREIQTVICLLNWKDVCISYLLTTLEEIQFEL